ncbi:hypothetical protein BJ170DRAFT_641893 [Xylariales sp. AK1849]|nr:hypothetical protein BJ170DRAFT_641893 [Xylariales sp. AK1849]
MRCLNIMMPRKPVGSLPKAEQQAYQGENESQDSQLIFERYHHELGIGLLSSSPASDGLSALQARNGRGIPKGPGSKSDSNISAQQGAKEQSKKLTQRDAFAARINRASQEASDQSSKANPSAPRSSRSSLTWEPNGDQQAAHLAPNSADHGPVAVISAPSPPVKKDALPQIPRSTYSVPLKRRKMDSSQSPTQENEGRSYDQYRKYEDVSSQREHDLAEPHESQRSRASTTHEHEYRTLHEGDPEAVVINWPPISEIADENEDDEAASPTPASEPAMTMRSQPSTHALSTFGRHSIAAMPAPETPMLPQRPRFQKDGPPASVMGPSQLFFMQTSGIKKIASPTSSRPSPAAFNQNTISPNPNASSPLQDRGLRTSPSNRLATTSPAYAAEPPVTSNATDPPAAISSPPHTRHSRARSRPEPIGDYVLIVSSSATPGDGSSVAEEDGQSDSDRDEPGTRRRLAQLMRDKADTSLTSIRFPRQNSKEEDIEVPSTNRQKPMHVDSGLSTADRYVEQCHGKIDTTDKGETQETVADSQGASTKNDDVQHAGTPSVPRLSMGVARSGDVAKPVQPELPTGPHRSNETTGSKETIPETSPARTTKPNYETAMTPIPMPFQSSSTANEHPYLNKPSHDSVPSSPPILGVAVTGSSQPARRSTRLANSVTPLALSSAEVMIPAPATTSSSLTAFSTTPTISSSTTPNTDKDDSETTDKGSTKRKGTVSSPAAAKVVRQAGPFASKLKTYSPVQSVRARGPDRSSKVFRESSVSTDELARSSAVSITDERRRSRSFARRSVQGARQEQLIFNTGIFDGMSFATSFQSPTEKISTEKVITRGGGTIISEGFNELFDVGSLDSDNALQLKAGRTSTGFTALITDIHSRKPKYMQALALGLPCLSSKWIAACDSRNALVDWSTYMLCAGESKILGAPCSRWLERYDARTAKLPQVIAQRPTLLLHKKILLIMKKSRKEEEKRMPYVFLAQALGATLVRVSSAEEARAQLREKEDTEDRFDLVYIDGGAEESLFGQVNPAPAASKKRKRQIAASIADGERPPKKVRSMTDELVVQSLILGRLVEEGEMQE